MKLPGRKATPTNPRITPEAMAEYNLLQQLALSIGQEALKQAGINYTPTHDLPGGGQLAEAEAYKHQEGNLKLDVTLTIEVNPRTTAAIAINPRKLSK